MTDQKRAVRDAYDELAAEYDARRTKDPANVAFLDEFRERLPADGRVLDAGCGAGRPVAESLAADFDLVGLDFSREQVRMASERVPSGHFVLGDMTALPLAETSVDGVVAYYSAIHVPTDEHPILAREFARVLRPGGNLLLTTGIGEWEGRNDDWLDTGVEMRWSFPAPAEIESMLEAVGFEVLWRRIADDRLGGDAAVVLAQKRE